MRVLVSASRTWRDSAIIISDLEAVLAESRRRGERMVLVHGKCPRGGDRIADDWYLAHEALGTPDLDIERHPADWVLHGRKRAGGIRNRKMAELGADRVLIYIHDDSPGVTGMLKLVRKLKLKRSVRVRHGADWDVPFVAPLTFEEEEGLW